jgi:hypothetical protein
MNKLIAFVGATVLTVSANAAIVNVSSMSISSIDMMLYDYDMNPLNDNTALGDGDNHFSFDLGSNTNLVDGYIGLDDYFASTYVHGYDLRWYSSNEMGSPVPTGWIDTTTGDISFDFNAVKTAFYVLPSEAFLIAITTGLTGSGLLDSSDYATGSWDSSTGEFTVTWIRKTNGCIVSNPTPGCHLELEMTGYVSTVPIPAGAWLFGSALLGLVGVKRRK